MKRLDSSGKGFCFLMRFGISKHFLNKFLLTTCERNGKDGIVDGIFKTTGSVYYNRNVYANIQNEAQILIYNGKSWIIEQNSRKFWDRFKVKLFSQLSSFLTIIAPLIIFYIVVKKGHKNEPNFLVFSLRSINQIRNAKDSVFADLC